MTKARALSAALTLASICFYGCSGEDSRSAIEHGRALFDSRELSPSELNRFACSTCHAAETASSTRRLPGAALAGATRRETFWGGQENDLLLAIEACRRHFMRAVEPLPRDSVQAEALYAFLQSLEPGDAEPVPFTVVRAIADVPRGDAARGGELYTAACGGCHGRARTGQGRLTRLAPVLPDDTLDVHPDYTVQEVRLVFIEKTRHGPFLGYGGSMPPFSAERLADDELGDILEFLDVLGQ